MYRIINILGIVVAFTVSCGCQSLPSDEDVGRWEQTLSSLERSAFRRPSVAGRSSAKQAIIRAESLRKELSRETQIIGAHVHLAEQDDFYVGIVTFFIYADEISPFQIVGRHGDIAKTLVPREDVFTRWKNEARLVNSFVYSAEVRFLKSETEKRDIELMRWSVLAEDGASGQSLFAFVEWFDDL